MLLRQFHFLRVAHELARQSRDAFRIGRGEQQGLALCRATLRHERDVLIKSHVQHAVRFVKHQRIERFQVQRAALHVVHDAPRRTDDDVGPVFQTGNLRAHGRAAAQRQNLDVVGRTRQSAYLLRDLVGQFARGAQHHGLHRKAARIQFGEQGQRECRRLAATRFRLRDQVVSRQRDRQAGCLYRRHRQVTELLQSLQHGRRQRQLVKRTSDGAVGVG